MLRSYFSIMIKVEEANWTDVLFYFYLKNSIEKLERSHRSFAIKPMEFMNLLVDSNPPVEFHRFWESSKNKENL